MTLQDLMRAYKENEGKPRIIRSIKDKREAKAFRKFLIMEIYRHIEDIQRGIADVEAITVSWKLPPESLDMADVNSFFKVR